MDRASQRDLRILTQIAERDDVTQRGLAKSLGIALGLTNLYLKRLARKGYIKITTIPQNRIKYLLTPQGFAEKTRLTYEYMRMSLDLYQQTRHAVRAAVQPVVLEGLKRFALYGTGEAAELVYLTLRELGLEPVAVYATTTDGNESGTFLGLPVRPATELTGAEVDRVIVAHFGAPADETIAALARLVPDEKLLVLGRPSV